MVAHGFDGARLGSVLLARIGASGAGGVARTDIVRELINLLAHKLSPAEWRAAVDRALEDLVEAGHATDRKSRLAITLWGRDAVAIFLGRRPTPSASWAEIRDTLLTGRALGIEGAAAWRIKALAKSDGLRAAILDQAFDLALGADATAASIRHALAVKASPGKGRLSRPVEVERTLARGLLRYRVLLHTDREIVARLAAEQVGAASSDPKSLRLAVLRKLFINLEAAHSKLDPKPAETGPEAPVVPPKPPRTKTTNLATGDLSAFAQCVLAAARRKAEGWPGNRKAFISHVWQSIRETDLGRAVSEAEFKARLTEAHRAGHLTLTNADLRDKARIGDVAASAVKYMNAEWHYVRVED